MKLSSIATISSLAILGSAELEKKYWAAVECTDYTVTKTVYVTVGGNEACTYAPGQSTWVNPPASTTAIASPPISYASAQSSSKPDTWVHPPAVSSAAPNPPPAAQSSKSDTWIHTPAASAAPSPPAAPNMGDYIASGVGYVPGAPSNTYTAPESKKTVDVELRTDMVNGKPVVHYVPDRVDANKGDFIRFKFRAAAHSVTQSKFDTPCTKLEGGFDSELIPNLQNLNGSDFERLFEVKTLDPTWFYCKQQNRNHCGQGMVFGINPAGKMDQFIQNAIKQNGALVDATPTSSVVSASSSVASSTTYAAASTATVVVSGGGGLPFQFTPPFLEKRNKGDTIVFDFRKLNHTLTESTLENPCKKKAGSVIDTNFENFNPQDIPLLTTKTVVLDTDANTPRYFYCRQGNGLATGHCLAGMVFAVNVDQDKFNVFQNNAKMTGVPPKEKRAAAFSA